MSKCTFVYKFFRVVFKIIESNLYQSFHDSEINSLVYNFRQQNNLFLLLTQDFIILCKNKIPFSFVKTKIDSYKKMRNNFSLLCFTNGRNTFKRSILIVSTYLIKLYRRMKIKMFLKKSISI